MARDVSDPVRALAAATISQAARDAAKGDDNAWLFLFDEKNAIWGALAGGLSWPHVRRWLLFSDLRIPRHPHARGYGNTILGVRTGHLHLEKR